MMTELSDLPAGVIGFEASGCGRLTVTWVP